MKNLFVVFAVFILLFSCTEKSKREDEKYLGHWKGHDLLSDGTYNYVDITLSNDDDYPYRVIISQHDGKGRGDSEFESRKCKIYDGYLFTQEGNIKGFSFKILEKENVFKCYCDKYHVVGSLINRKNNGFN